KKNIRVYPCSYQRLSAVKSGKGKKSETGGKSGKGGKGGGDDVSPGINRSTGMFSPFSGGKGRLQGLCSWRGRRESR
ncbi:MAG TPA: hypothetical protein DCZ04_14215, partial [Syntrophorhabdus aromaticivorans]|nr:hypothetical protein [Syntrophorhabdus aromaticivorans]